MSTHKTAVITGAHGFIGQHLIAELKRQEISYIELPRELLYDKVKLVDFFAKYTPDYIFHLAAYGNMAHQKNILEILDANVNALFDLLVASISTPYKAFINISTSSVTLHHQTLYSATKASGEYLCKAFVDEYHKPIVSVRPYSIYGPGEADHRFIPTVFRSCMSGEAMLLAPKPVHDWVYVDDFVKNIVNYATRHIENIIGKTISIGSGKSTSNREIVQMIEGITGHKAHYSLALGMRSWDNISWKAENEGIVDYARIPLKMGLQKIYDQLRP